MERGPGRPSPSAATPFLYKASAAATMEGPVGRNRAPVLSSDFEILHAPSGKPPGEGGCRANPNLRESRRHEAALGGRRRAALVYIYIWKYLSMTGGPDMWGRGWSAPAVTSWPREHVPSLAV